MEVLIMKRVLFAFALSLLLLAACGKDVSKSDNELERGGMRVVISFDDQADVLSDIVFSSFLHYDLMADSKEAFLEEHERTFDERDKFFNKTDGMSYTYKAKDDHIEDELRVDYDELDEDVLKTIRVIYRMGFEEENSGKVFAEQLLDDGFEKREDD